MANIPKTHKKIMVQKLSTDFRAAVTIETSDVCQPKNGEVCVRNRYIGINASDINATKGRYFTDGKVPFQTGFEGIGEVVNVGSGVSNMKIGDVVVYFASKHNAFAEYACIPSTDSIVVPEVKPEYLVLLVSGLTAAIGLDKNARITSGETVLITAAAGGTGHIAVQWAKAVGCHVIGTCSSEEKVKLLKELGCDRVINYKEENLDEVLSKEYPRGIDVIWETIGGSVFETCVRSLAIKGRLLVVGKISTYKEENRESAPKLDLSTLPETLLFKSASVQGYLLTHYVECYHTYFKHLLENVESGKLRAIYDLGEEDELVGMEGIIKGVEYLHSGKNIGKVVVKLP